LSGHNPAADFQEASLREKGFSSLEHDRNLIFANMGDGGQARISTACPNLCHEPSIDDRELLETDGTFHLSVIEFFELFDAFLPLT
jgi:hypothetical protein